MVMISPQIAKLVIQIPSNTVTKKQNQTLTVGVNYTYVGPAQRVYWTAVVTEAKSWNEFDEIGSTKKTFYTDFPEALTPKSYSLLLSGLPLSGVAPKTTAYGVKVKAEGTFGTVEAGNKSCLYVTEVTEIPLITDFVIVTPTKSTWIGGGIYITVMFNYIGPAITAKLYVAIGNQNSWFNEKWDSGWVSFPIAEAASKVVKLASAWVYTPSGNPGIYDIYAKIDAPGIADVFTPVYLNTITITL